MLEPGWEIRFEAHSYGFRPGRSTHDAIAAIVVAIERHPSLAEGVVQTMQVYLTSENLHISGFADLIEERSGVLVGASGV